MKFKTRIMSTAVAAAVGTFAGAAQAVNLGNDGMGQVLIYPYYTVQQKGDTAFDTYISIVNSDTVNGKAVKVRFLEGKNSVEVLDFNLYLSPNDVWSGTITRNPDGSGNAIMQTLDNSCTVPEIPPGGVAGATSTTAGVLRWQPFTNVAYALDAVKDASMGRAREGYVELIQMADVVPGLLTSSLLNTFNASKHNTAGVPPNCAAIRAAWAPAGITNDYSTPPNDGVSAPTGGLSGAGTIINPIEGTDFSYDAVAVDKFSAIPLHFAPGSIQPQLNDVNPKVSAVFDDTDIVLTSWAGAIPGVLPVSAILARSAIVNVYAVGAAGTALATDWLVTFPTKNKHIAEALAANKAPFTSTLGTTGACEVASATAYNREEQVQTSPLGFSPPTPAGVFSLCWETNVVSMVNGGTTSNVFGGLNTRSTLSVPYAEGWLNLGFAQARVAPAAATTRINTGTGVVTAGLTSTYTGLPVVGFAGIAFVNTGTIPNTNYGGVYGHSYLRNIAP